MLYLKSIILGMVECVCVSVRGEEKEEQDGCLLWLLKFRSINENVFLC